jgi:amidophosphoribosyltransferase
LIETVHRGNPEIENFDTSCFSGEYVTGDVTPEYLALLEQSRSDSALEDQNAEDDAVIDMHNSA